MNLFEGKKHAWSTAARGRGRPTCNLEVHGGHLSAQKHVWRPSAVVEVTEEQEQLAGRGVLVLVENRTWPLPAVRRKSRAAPACLLAVQGGQAGRHTPLLLENVADHLLVWLSDAGG